MKPHLLCQFHLLPVHDRVSSLEQASVPGDATKVVGLNAKWQGGTRRSKMMKMSDGDSTVLNQAQGPAERGTLPAWVICS